MSTKDHDHLPRLTIAATAGESGVGALRTALERQFSRWAAESDGGVARVTERSTAADLSGSHVARTMSGEVPFDLTFSLWARGFDVGALSWSVPVTELIEAHTGAVWVCAGWQCHFFGRTDAYVLHTVLRRNPVMTHTRMSEYWHSEHTALSTYPRFRGYHQFHVDPEPTAAAAVALGLPGLVADGITEPYFDDYEHLRTAMSDPRMAVPAADEPSFLDSAACTYAFSRVAYLEPSR